MKKVSRKQPVNVFAFGETLVQCKEELIRHMVGKAQLEGTSVVTAERKAASFFYKFAEQNWGLTQPITAQYVRVYERFVESRHRAEMEALFNAGELTVLAAYSDDELAEIVSAKAANPSLTREGIKQLLKTRQAA
ncbi:hypothetical protein [Caballeronia sp. GaOx3]|uniref:hypothetical protein n=1 Tax=Caballeronia sp. GaOx3 TaxID=2921740 RepID=UPI0020296990|nr:hypothetical protein [Caballeronia sp. GaOx3]